MLANYNRWVFEQKKVECIETLCEWIIQEAEFQTVVAETYVCLQENEEVAHTHSLVGQAVQESLLAQIVHFVRKIIQRGTTKSLGNGCAKSLTKG